MSPSDDGSACERGAVGGILKMCVDKWAAGEEITWKDVGRAAAVGAIEGLVTLAGAGLANAATGAITTKVGEEVAKRLPLRLRCLLSIQLSEQRSIRLVPV